MNCEKCGIDASLTHRDVDGFAYYLCDACVDAWEAVRASSPGSADENRSPAR
jgi:hypothetical protein